MNFKLKAKNHKNNRRTRIISLHTFKERHYVNSWSKFSTWQDVTPPSRPAKWQIDVCRNKLKEVSRTKPIAVLGSTIEYRDLLGEMGFHNVFIFDKNKAFYDYITPFASHKLCEKMIEGDWLHSIYRYKNYFSIILSDLTSGNIPYRFREKYYKIISSALTNNGNFIDRVLTKPFSFLPLDSLVKKYKTLSVNNKNTNSFNCEILFCSELLNNPKNIVDTSAFYDKLSSFNIPRISEFIESCYKITPRDCIWWYSKDWKIEKKLYEYYFNIKYIYEEPKESEYFNRAKLFISSKKVN
jgi:hypothetical protein